MDTSYSGSLAGGTTVIVMTGILYKIYNTINNRQIKIMCCGRKFSASVEIGKTKHKQDKSTPSSSSNDSVLDISDERKKNEHKYARLIQAAYRGHLTRRRIQFEQLIERARSSPECILRPHSAAKK